MTDKTQPEALRLAKYVARRKLAKQLDANEIHGLDSGCETEAVLLLSDIEALLAQVAALTAVQQPAPQQRDAQEPVAWYVTGCGRLLDEDEAKAEARHVGGTARAIPLYTAPQPSPKADSQPAPVREHDLQDVRCECCGYMTYHREHMGCIRAARAPADSVLEDAEDALRKVLGVVQRYLPPDGQSAHDAMSEIIAIVDPWPLGPLEKS